MKETRPIKTNAIEEITACKVTFNRLLRGTINNK